MHILRHLPTSFLTATGKHFCPPPRSESSSRSLTALDGVSLGSGTPPPTLKRRGVYKPANHLAWLEMQLALFPESRSK